MKKKVVTFACDTGNKYLSKLFNNFWMEDHGFIRRKKFGDLRDFIGRLHSEGATSTVGPTDTLTTAHNRLRNSGYSQLPVLSDGQLLGMITEKTIINFAIDRPELMLSAVDEAMELTFPKLDKKDSFNDLKERLSEQSYTVILDGNKFLGLITRSDLMNFLRKKI